jgi:hypothetical protein
VGSLSILQWLLVVAVVALAFVAAAGSLPRLLSDVRRLFGGASGAATEAVPAHPSWVAIGVLFLLAIAVLAASASFNGTWAG